jgi:hypothetical protein
LANLLGAHLGPDEDLMPAKPDNPTGFWESLTVAQFHDDLIAYLGGRWDIPPVLPDGWESNPVLAPFAERIGRIVRTHFASFETAVWKDPRGSLLLPLWRRVVPITGTVLCVRHPDGVAGSLGKRDGFDAERAAALWLRYVVSAYRQDAAHLLVTFDEIYERPEELATRLAAFIGAPPPSETVLREMRAFVDPNLRHRETLPAEVGPILRLARAAYALLTTKDRHVVAPFFGVLSDSWQLEARLDHEARAVLAVRERLGPSVVRLLEPS